jgi:hypothetical protein
VVELFGLQEDRHTVVDFGHALIGLADNHGAGFDTFACLLVLPLIPKAGRPTIVRTGEPPVK